MKYWRRFTAYLSLLRLQFIVGFMKAADKSGKYHAEIERAESIIRQRKELNRNRRAR